MLVWYPKVNTGPSVFVKIGDVNTAVPFRVGTLATDWKAAGF